MAWGYVLAHSLWWIGLVAFLSDGNLAKTVNAGVLQKKILSDFKHDPATQTSPRPTAPTPTVPVTKPEVTNSTAERIIRAQRNLESNRKTLNELKSKLESPQSEYNLTEEEFSAIDLEYQAKTERLEQLSKKPADQRLPHEQAKWEELSKELPELKKTWELMRKRFDLAIVEQKTLQEKVTSLAQQIQQEEAALEALKKGSASATTKTNDEKKTAPESLTTKSTTPTPSVPTSATPTAAKDTPSTAPGIPIAPGILLPLESTPSEPKGNAATTPVKMQPEDEALIKARKEASKRHEALEQAKDKTRAVSERIETLQQNILLEKKLLETAIQKSDALKQLLNRFEAEVRQKQSSGATEPELRDQRKRIEDLTQEFNANQVDQGSIHKRLDEMYNQLHLLQTERIAALKLEAAAKQEAEQAEQTIASLKNPFSVHKLLQWLIQNGPTVLLIIIVMIGLHHLVRVSSKRIAQFIAAHGRRGSLVDRENRAKTLVGVFSNATTLLILIGGTMMLLEVIGIPIIPLMGGAALFGLAVAFGAQNLIRDYFSGFMVLMEDQYGINDYVRIGNLEGLVERITLRVTTLRDVHGVAHFVPHGSISSVSNFSHTWSRAFIEISVSYKEDTDFVVKILTDLAAELRRDEHFGPMILEDAVMWGLDSFADSAVVIKFHIKTKPLMHGNVKRELLRRIKKRFDKLKIEIPFPQRTLHVRAEGQLPVTLNQPQADAA